MADIYVCRQHGLSEPCDLCATNPTPTQPETLDKISKIRRRALVDGYRSLTLKDGTASLALVQARADVLEVLDILDRAAVTAPRGDRALYSELIHIAAELARGTDFLSTCAEDMNPRLKRADILKTAERQELQLKDWANRVRQVADQLSAAPVAGPRGDVRLILLPQVTKMLAAEAYHYCADCKSHCRQLILTVEALKELNRAYAAATSSPTPADVQAVADRVNAGVDQMDKSQSVDAATMQIQFNPVPAERTRVEGEQDVRLRLESVAEPWICVEDKPCEEVVPVHWDEMITALVAAEQRRK